MKKYAQENFPSLTYLNYALAVEKYTLTKAPNLVLNVDGCIGTPPTKAKRWLHIVMISSSLSVSVRTNVDLNPSAALFLDLMTSCAAFSAEEMNEIVEIGYLNGLFLVGRSIGLVGHALDQKRYIVSSSSSSFIYLYYLSTSLLPLSHC
jgi:ATP citrate (pro-S)-lyase